MRREHLEAARRSAGRREELAIDSAKLRKSLRSRSKPNWSSIETICQSLSFGRSTKSLKYLSERDKIEQLHSSLARSRRMPNREEEGNLSRQPLEVGHLDQRRVSPEVFI